MDDRIRDILQQLIEAEITQDTRDEAEALIEHQHMLMGKFNDVQMLYIQYRLIMDAVIHAPCSYHYLDQAISVLQIAQENMFNSESSTDESSTD